MALALGLAVSPDLPFQQWQPAVGGVVAGLTALFVVALLDRRAPRRLVAVGAATVALAETDAKRRARVTPRRAAAVAGYRVGAPQRVATGGARLVVRVSGGAE